MVTEINKDLYVELLEKEVSRLKRDINFLEVKLNALSSNSKPEPEKVNVDKKHRRKGASLGGVMGVIEKQDSDKAEEPKESLQEVPFE